MDLRKPKTETLRDEIKRRAGQAKLAWQKFTGKKLNDLVPISSEPHTR